MYDRLSEVKGQHENKKKEDFFGVTLHPRDIDWLIEQAEKVERLEEYIGQLKHENNLLYGRLNNIIALASKEIK